MPLFESKSEVNTITAEENGIAIGGDNNGSITVTFNDYRGTSDTSGLEQKLGTITELLNNLSGAGLSKDNWQNELDKFIESYKEKLESGQARTALDLFQKLIEEQSANLSPAQLFRINANMGICEHHLANNKKAAQLIRKACAYTPDTAESKAFLVLAYLFEEKTDEAYQYAFDELNKDNKNIRLASYGLNAAQFCNDNGHFYECIDLSIRNKEQVESAYIAYLCQIKAEDWLLSAKEAAQRHPKNRIIAKSIALGELDIIAEEHLKNGHSVFPIANKEAVDGPLKILREDWDENIKSEMISPAIFASEAYNIMLCYSFKADLTNIKQFGTHLIERFPNNEKLMNFIIGLALDFNLNELFELAICNIRNQSQKLEFQFYNRVFNIDWKSLRDIKTFDLDKYGKIKETAIIARFIARLKLGESRAFKELRDYLSDRIISTDSGLVFLKLSLAANISALLNHAHEYGIKNLKVFNNDSSAVELSRICQLKNDWNTIIQLLRARAKTTRASDSLNMLSLAYLNTTPIRKEASDFFKNLSENGMPSLFVTLVAGAYCYKTGELEQAESLLKDYLGSDGDDVQSILFLCDIALLQHKPQQISTYLDHYNAGALRGSPEQLMHVAKLYAQHGYSEKGLDLAYKLYSENKNNERVALGYVHVFLISSRKNELESINKIQSGVSFTLKSDQGDLIQRTVPSNIEDAFILSPNEVEFFIRKSFGLKTGESFEVEKTSGTVIWTVDEIKHSYVECFQYLIKNYELLFPEANDLYLIRTDGNNIQPLLDQIRTQSERERKNVTELYSQQFPLSAMAKMWNISVLEIAGLVNYHAGGILTCSGTQQDYDNAHRIISNIQRRGLVLDTYTVWVASHLGVLPALKKAFGNIYIHQCSLTSLLQAAHHIEANHSDSPSFNVGYCNGKYIKTELTVEQKRELVLSANERIAQIKCETEAVMYPLPDTLDAFSEQLVSMLGDDVIESYFLAKGMGLTFVSDDLNSRRMAAGIYSLHDTTWLQPLIIHAANQGFISAEHYRDCIIHLASIKHGFVSIDSMCLEYAFNKSRDTSLYEFRALANYLGGPMVDTESHFLIISTFIMYHWRGFYKNTSYLNDIRRQQATSILLERIITFPEKEVFLFRLARVADRNFRIYLNQWLTGHYIRTQ